MKIRTLAAALAVAAVAALPLAGVASAQTGDRDCPDFATQAEAQQALESRVGDPERLDRNKNGLACEERFGGAAATTPDPAPSGDDDAPTTGQVVVVPQGGVDTGDGTSTGDATPLLVLLLGGTTAVGAVALGRRAAHQR